MLTYDYLLHGSAQTCLPVNTACCSPADVHERDGYAQIRGQCEVPARLVLHGRDEEAAELVASQWSNEHIGVRGNLQQ